MKRINDDTHGLANAIIEETLSQLNEGPFTDKLKSVGSNIAQRASQGAKNFGNAALSALGSATATGKTKQAAATKHLLDGFKEYARGRPATSDMIYDFLKHGLDGQLANIADYVKQNLLQNQSQQTQNNQPANQNQPGQTDQQSVANQNQPVNGQNAQTPVGQSPAPTNGTAAPAGATAPTTPPNPNNTASTAANIMKQPDIKPLPAKSGSTPALQAGQVMSDITQSASAAKPNKTQVMRQVHQLLQIASAQGKDSPEFKQAINNLKSVQSAYGNKIPELNQIDLSAFSESTNRCIIGLTTYLIENRITSRQKIDEAYYRIVLQEANQRVFSPKELYALFDTIAGRLMDSGGMSVGDSKFSQWKQGPQNNQNNYQNSGDQKRNSHYNSKNASVDPYAILQTAKINPNTPEGKSILNAIKSNPTGDVSDLFQHLDKNIKLSGDAIDAILDAYS